MNWTTERPTKMGWYWHSTHMGLPYPVKVFLIGNLRYVWLLDEKVSTPTAKRLEEYSGEWAGPLELPQ